MPPSVPLRPVRFVEPTEGAYSLFVPEGWGVDGGVQHMGADPRPWYRVRSPAGGAELRGYDPRIPPAFVDSMMGMMSMPLPGMVPRPFVPPMPFAEEYARQFARECGASQFSVTGTRDVETILREDSRPESRPRVMMLMQQGALVGGITFVCADRGLTGLVDVTIVRAQTMMGLVWSPFLTAMIGPTDAWPHVKATLQHIASSNKPNAAWQQFQQQRSQMQHQMAMDSINTGNRILQMQHQSGMEGIAAHAHRAQMSAQSNAEVSAMQQDGWRAQQASIDEQHRRNVNAVREVVDVVDPVTGTVYRGAPAGFASYWTDGARDHVVASEGHQNPDASRFTEAQNLDDVKRR